jgi:hypothetical protein
VLDQDAVKIDNNKGLIKFKNLADWLAKRRFDMAQSMRKSLLEYIAKKSQNTTRRRTTAVELNEIVRPTSAK